MFSAASRNQGSEGADWLREVLASAMLGFGDEHRPGSEEGDGVRGCWGAGTAKLSKMVEIPDASSCLNASP